MADKENPQLSQDDLLAQIAELQAEVRRIAELPTQNNGENSKGSAQSTADPLNIVPPKEKLTLDNPFSEEITNYQMPKNFTLPTALEPYKGFGDPRAHVKKFQSMMFFNGPNNEPVLCRAFPTYLDGAALLWFSKLSAGSISSFEDLARSFIDYFAASRIYVHGLDFLGTIKQGQHESLKDYMTRFADATMEIQDLDPAVHLHALKAGLRPGKFRETIAITKPKTLEEFRERAAGQMEIEELREAQKSDKQPHRRDEERTFRSPGNRDTKKPPEPASKYNTYTRFNTRRENIIREILNARIIKPPARAGNYQDQRFVDKTKHCAFHRKFGHTTDDCIVAKDLLERLARQGLLDKYIETRKGRGGNSDRAEHKQATADDKKERTTPDPPRGVINHISGGFAGGGETSSARKRSYRTMLAIEGTIQPKKDKEPDVTISFNQTDFKLASPNLDDPVVISIQVGELLVRKTLLDPGSSADILFYSTFTKMKLSEKLIQPSSGELIGFSGERVPIMGHIWLKTTMGEIPTSKSIDIQYLIVNCYSPYNIILGRPALNIFRAVVSTLHLCVKFPVQENKIATVYADHQEARQCYNAGLKPVQTEQEARPQVQAIHMTANSATLADLDPREDLGERPRPMDDLQQITLTADDKPCTYVGEALEGTDRARLIHILRQNADLFAWTPDDMPGINPEVICHKLAIDKTIRPVAQKKRNLGEEKKQAALEETQKLLNAGFIREIRFTTWLSNVVMILMHPEDQSKTAFITEHGNFCYKVMPFGLKNAGATYQRLMDKVFQQQIGRNMEVYVDDMVAKTPMQGSHCDDLVEIFRQLRAYNMRLNPDKCAFGVQGGKFLGFMLTSRGIEANPEKCRAVLNMTSPKTVKEVQQLAGRIAALSRFLPAVANRFYHFFQTFSKGRKFNWTDECENAFTELKQHLTSPPILQRPETGNPLYLYLSVSNHAISSVLVTETGRKQSPVYFISRVLQPTETRYPKIEQLALALVTTARRLRHYFQSHTIIVRTDQPLRQILTRPELAGRLIKWSVKLSEFDIQYDSRKTLKSQVLADFISEMTNDTHNTEVSWSIHVDGASNKEGSGAGILLKEGDKVVAEQSLQFRFNASNNQAEYEALLAGLKLALQLQIPRITAYCDSSLVVHQIKGEFQVPDWRTPFFDYINTGTIPKGEPNLPLFRRRASFYTVLGNTLYRRGHSQPLLKCISKEEAEEVMAETHEGVCGNHIGGRALATKILRTGYYWPTIKRDCITKVKACDNCQKHATLSETPAEELHTIEVSWPFDRWGLDILGPFPKAPGQVKFLLVSIDYFSKWIEAQPLAHITAEKVRSFIWKNIICRYGIPREIISDNGRQFTDHKLATFLTNFNIKHHFSSVEHPQTNGQVESANRIILQGLKKKLSEAKGEWADLIPEILWSYNTSIQTATGETPFKLVYGAEALIPVEVSVPTLRTELYNQPNNQQARSAELDLVEEDKDISAIKQRARKRYLEQRHHKRVVHRSFNNGDLVLRRTEDARKPPAHGKLAANWEGPFRVLQNLGKGGLQIRNP
ncbi:uncharacterized protein [Arachis hypogaea]|uniref:uncharacterized protein n=1 Tax=Arachis hypogaea TaxID=3818 RepID=UPI000DEDA345|nr:uncharacterized protein LOC112769517 [Arachis hypogaea]